MAAPTQPQGVFEKLDGMSVPQHVHTYDAELLPSLATEPRGLQQTLPPNVFAYLAQRPRSGQHASTIWVESEKNSLADVCTCATPSVTQHIAQPSASCLETFLDTYGKTYISMHPKTATSHPVSLPTSVEPRVTMTDVTSTISDSAARLLPSQTPDCHTAVNTLGESVTESVAQSTGQTTTHGRESTDPVLGNSEFVGTGKSSLGAQGTSTAVGSSPEAATNHSGGDPDAQETNPRSGIFRMTAETSAPHSLSACSRPHGRPIPAEETPDKRVPDTILAESRHIFPVRNKHWHSAAVVKKCLASYWACVIASKTEHPNGTDDPASNGASVDQPALWMWIPETPRAEKSKDKSAKYRIQKNHVEPAPEEYSRLTRNFLIWEAGRGNDERWLAAYKAWVTSVDDAIQPVSSSSGGIGPNTIGTLRGGAGTLDDLNNESPEEEEEDEPTNGTANGHMNGYTNGYVNGHTNGYVNGHTNGHANGHVNTPDNYVPAGGHVQRSVEEFIEYIPDSPRSRHSVLSGYSTDLSRAASEAFHEQNARAEADGNTSRSQRSSGSPSVRPGNDSDEVPRRPFSFDTMPTSGSRSMPTSPDRPYVAESRTTDIEPGFPSPSWQTGSSADDGMDTDTGEHDPLINPRPAAGPSNTNVPDGVPPIGHAYEDMEESPPAETQPHRRRRRRDRVRHALRREQLRQRVSDQLTRGLRNILVMGSKEQRAIRRERE